MEETILSFTSQILLVPWFFLFLFCQVGRVFISSIVFHLILSVLCKWNVFHCDFSIWFVPDSFDFCGVLFCPFFFLSFLDRVPFFLRIYLLILMWFLSNWCELQLVWAFLYQSHGFIWLLLCSVLLHLFLFLVGTALFCVKLFLILWDSVTTEVIWYRVT